MWEWGVFLAVVAVLLCVDLLVSGRGRAGSTAAALRWSGAWVGAGLLFGGFVWFALGTTAAQEYVAAYAVELSLSLDNMFVFLLILGSLGLRRQSQHKVLFWGILGAAVFRGIFVYAGAEALTRFQWLSYLLGAGLLYAAYRAVRTDPRARKDSGVVAWLAGHLPVTKRSDSRTFTVVENGRRVATPLLVAIVAIEASDIVFAIDSVPAALSMSRNQFVVYSSNMFAILGLRALYLVLARTIADMRYLHYGLAAILAFAGIKIALVEWISIPPLISAGAIIAVVGISVAASLSLQRGK